MENEKSKRIGTMTFGVLLIVLGVSFMISMFAGFGWMRYTAMLWPVFLISLGAEALYYNAKGNIKIIYDFWGFVVMGCLLIFALGTSVAGLAYNTVVSNTEISANFEKVAIEASKEMSERITGKYQTDFDYGYENGYRDALRDNGFDEADVRLPGEGYANENEVADVSEE